MRMYNFQDMVDGELERARSLHPNNFRNAHEAYAVILEEMDEFWQEVKKKQSLRDPERLREELVQIAAMCQRTAEDLGFVKRSSYEKE